MNQFETKINALRLQYKAERIQIQKDCALTIGHLNNAIGQVTTIEAREALRAEKQRVYEATRQSMKYNRLCYAQQAELLFDRYRTHPERSLSGRAARKAMALLYDYARATGVSEMCLSFGNRKFGVVSFPELDGLIQSGLSS